MSIVTFLLYLLVTAMSHDKQNIKLHNKMILSYDELPSLSGGLTMRLCCVLTLVGLQSDILLAMCGL